MLTLKPSERLEQEIRGQTVRPFVPLWVKR